MSFGLPVIECGGRIDSVVAVLDGASLLIEAGPQLRWLTGFNGSAGWLLANKSESVLFVDARYTERAREQIAMAGLDLEVITNTNYEKLFNEIASRHDGNGLVINGSDVDVITYRKIADAFKVEPIVKEDPTAQFRRIKTPAELARIELAAKITDIAVAKTLTLDWTTFTERELASRLAIEMRAAGSDREAFDTIVASGPNGSRPHHESGDRRIAEGDAVIVDIGSMIDGYHSDMTRTFFIGAVDPFLAEAYAVVEAAQGGGVRECVPGAELAEVDAACRGVLRESGLERYFTTGTGHGIGLKIHEDPFVGKTSKGMLLLADIITVEPGIYCEGVGGIRIEDTVSLESGGPRRITLTTKDTSCPR